MSSFSSNLASAKVSASLGTRGAKVPIAWKTLPTAAPELDLNRRSFHKTAPRHQPATSTN